MVILAMMMSFVLCWANRVFHVEVDRRVEKINDALPGANCGGCGYVGCNEYAEAVVFKGEDVTKCTVGGAACAEAVGEIMGVEVTESWAKKAVVHCGAETKDKKLVGDYRGEMTCAAATIVGGVQGCVYGCLGFGDCVVVCGFDAIHIVNGLAKVDYEKCTGCGACIKACPRGVISLVEFKAEKMMIVACSNRDAGVDARKVCSVACIGCKSCAKVCDLFEIKNNLAELDYEVYEPDGASEGLDAAEKKCPTDSLVYVGKVDEAAAVGVGVSEGESGG